MSALAKYNWHQGTPKAASKDPPCKALPTSWDCYLMPLAIVDFGGDHGVGVAAS